MRSYGEDRRWSTTQRLEEIGNEKGKENDENSNKSWFLRVVELVQLMMKLHCDDSEADRWSTQSKSMMLHLLQWIVHCNRVVFKLNTIFNVSNYWIPFGKKKNKYLPFINCYFLIVTKKIVIFSLYLLQFRSNI